VTALSPEEFGALFDRFEVEAFRLETLPVYLVDEETEQIAAWRACRPRPERSVRTDPWLRRIALTAAAGRSWRRVHVVRLPLSEYVTWELIGYGENQTAGEQIRIAERTASLAELPEFWLFDGDLFDGDASSAYAAEMRYDADGRYLGAELATEPARLEELRAARDLAWRAGVPLNEFLVADARRAGKSA
jgi:hypothetical protein